MQVVVEKSGQVRLVEPDDFRRFQVTVEGAPSLDDLRRFLSGVGRLEDETTAWIDEAALRRLGPPDAEWQAKAGGMIAGAARHGWIDEKTGAIRAHVVTAG